MCIEDYFKYCIIFNDDDVCIIRPIIPGIFNEKNIKKEASSAEFWHFDDLFIFENYPHLI